MSPPLSILRLIEKVFRVPGSVAPRIKNIQSACVPITFNVGAMIYQRREAKKVAEKCPQCREEKFSPRKKEKGPFIIKYEHCSACGYYETEEGKKKMSVLATCESCKVEQWVPDFSEQSHPWSRCVQSLRYRTMRMIPFEGAR